MNNAILVSCIKGSGVEEYIEDKLNMLYIPSLKYCYTRRKRTAEELGALRQQWDDELHLLSGTGRINQIKDDLVSGKNEDYPSNYVSKIKSVIEEAKSRDDIYFIFIDLDAQVIEELEKEHLKVFVILSPDELQDIYIGRSILYNKKNDKPILSHYANLYTFYWDLRYTSNCLDVYAKNHPKRKTIFDRDMSFDEALEEVLFSLRMNTMYTYQISFTINGKDDSIQFCANNKECAIKLFRNWLITDNKIDRNKCDFDGNVLIYGDLERFINNIEIVYNKYDEEAFLDSEDFYGTPDDYKLLHKNAQFITLQ